MRKIFATLAFVAVSVASTFANSYTIDDQKVDAMFSSATEMALPAFNANCNSLNSTSAAAMDDKGKVVLATVVCYFVGGFGVHRYILGTNKPMFVWYTCSACGIFGIVPFVDFWVLLIDGVINSNKKYLNNDKFIMWI